MNALQTIDESKYQLVVPDLSVNNQITYENAIKWRNKAVERKKLIEDELGPYVESAHLAHKKAVELRSKVLNPVLQIIATIDGNIRYWKREQERKAQEEQDRLKREAEEKAAKEKAKLEV